MKNPKKDATRKMSSDKQPLRVNESIFIEIAVPTFTHRIIAMAITANGIKSFWITGLPILARWVPA